VRGRVLRMNVGRDVVIGVDGSVESLEAVKLGARIAGCSNSRVLLVNVVNYDMVFRLGVHMRDGIKAMVADGEAVLKAASSTAGCEVDTQMVEGDPAVALLSIAADRGAGLVVVGHKGMGSLEHIVLGSVATKVVHHSDRPILVVKSGAGLIADGRGIKVLAAIDGSAESIRAADESIKIAGSTSGSVRLLHVIHFPLVSTTTDIGVRFHEQYAEAVRSAGDALIEKAESLGASVEFTTVSGAPAKLILAEAESYGADIISVGSKSTSGLSGLRLGSVSENLLRQSPYSVMVCPRRLVVAEATG